jgi:putative phosphoesterase
MRVAVLSDTHGPRHWKACPPGVAEHLRSVDAILHAGDVCIPDVLDELSAFAPVRVVRGNNDGPDVAAWGAPDRLDFELDALPIGMVHDSGPAVGRGARLRRMCPQARLVVFGHSHIPLDEVHGQLRIFNPGSPTDRRRQPHGTMGLLEIDAGDLISARIVPVT